MCCVQFQSGSAEMYVVCICDIAAVDCERTMTYIVQLLSYIDFFLRHLRNRRSYA